MKFAHFCGGERLKGDEISKKKKLDGNERKEDIVNWLKSLRLTLSKSKVNEAIWHDSDSNYGGSKWNFDAVQGASAL